MNETALIIVVAIATIASAGVFTRNLHEIYGGIASAVMWFVAAFGATAIEKTTSCCTVTYSEPGFAFLLTGAGLLMLLVGVAGLDRVVPADFRDDHLGSDRS